MSDHPITILAIESSCDDTSAAVMQDGVLLSNVTASQAVHEAYGGVVPELASRAHQQNIVPVVDQALKKANVKKSDLSAIAVTLGPGLMGSLLVGVSFAKGMAMALGIPPDRSQPPAGTHPRAFHTRKRRAVHAPALPLSLPTGQRRKFADCQSLCLQQDGDSRTNH